MWRQTQNPSFQVAQLHSRHQEPLKIELYNKLFTF